MLDCLLIAQSNEMSPAVFCFVLFSAGLAIYDDMWFRDAKQFPPVTWYLSPTRFVGKQRLPCQRDQGSTKSLFCIECLEQQQHCIRC